MQRRSKPQLSTLSQTRSARFCVAEFFPSCLRPAVSSLGGRGLSLPRLLSPFSAIFLPLSQLLHKSQNSALRSENVSNSQKQSRTTPGAPSEAEEERKGGRL